MGYLATDFQNAGYDAGELCYIKHLLPLTDAEDLTPGVKEQATTCASFTATQLWEANYPRWELKSAVVSDEELWVAGYVEGETQCVLSAKSGAKCMCMYNIPLHSKDNERGQSQKHKSQSCIQL